jgi:hypothetical protein
MKFFSIVIAAAAICACNSSTKSSEQLSLSVTAAANASDAGTAAFATVSRVRLSVAYLKLEGAAAASDAATGDDDEIVRGPFLVDLAGAALTGSIQEVFDAEVPAGSYREFSLSIAPSSAAALGVLAAQGVSLIVDGSFNGAPFTFTSTIAISEKKEGTFTVGASTGNVTLSLNPAAWFGTAAAPLDPSLAANRAAIEGNIRASFKAFRDDDRNGHDDDGDDAGDDHGGDRQADAGGYYGGNGDDHGQADGGEGHGHDGADAGVADGGDDRDGGGHGADDGIGHH